MTTTQGLSAKLHHSTESVQRRLMKEKKAQIIVSSLTSQPFSTCSDRLYFNHASCRHTLRSDHLTAKLNIQAKNTVHTFFRWMLLKGRICLFHVWLTSYDPYRGPTRIALFSSGQIPNTFFFISYQKQTSSAGGMLNNAGLQHGLIDGPVECLN